ncbi:MAG: sigma-70 family RNA polymerase sigma factor [Bacteroidia bacterium]|nr:sigma-70 family RNA polymerase sigma factor [Bacteroidia bacterium]
MTKAKISDQELIDSYRSGNEMCLETLIKRHKSKVFTTIYLIVHDRYLAEDLFQETFIKVVQTFKSDKYNEEGKFLPWVLRIGRNLAIDYFRKAKRTPVITDTAGNDVLSFISIAEESREDQMMRKENERSIRDLIKLLPEEQREVLIMRHYGDMSFKEIADATGVSINTALGRMRYALNNMRKMMQEKEMVLR